MAKAGRRDGHGTDELVFMALGGIGEIGMNCMVLEYEDEIVVVDCGLLFSDLDQFGVEFVIPDFTYLLERKDKVKAFLVTHGHEDHIGALPFAIKAGIRAPIYASPFSSLLLRERLTEHGFSGPAREALQRVAASIVEQMAGAIAQRLEIPAEDARTLIDRGPFVAGEALAILLREFRALHAD